MESKSILIGLLIGTVLGGAVVFILTPTTDTAAYQSQIDDLEASVSSLEDANDRLQDQLDTLQIQVSDMQSSLDEKDIEIEGLEREVEIISSERDSLDSEVEELAEENEALKAIISTAQDVDETPIAPAEATRLGFSSAFNDQNPAFSPDGETILFSSMRNGIGLNLWKSNIDETEATPLTEEDDADNVNMPGSSWNGPTDRVCFSSDRSGNDEIWVMDPDGGNLVQITDHPARDWEPTFSPDGAWIAFQSDRDGNWEIYKVNIESREVVRLTFEDSDDWEPNWSPVGGKIVFQSIRDGDWEIYTMNEDGSGQIDITNDPAEDTDPSWSPDGMRIVYSSDHGVMDEADIFVRYADGIGDIIRVTDHQAYDGAPSFSPDGDYIAFESDRSGALDIWIIAFSINS